jgi:hypothetical protein
MITISMPPIIENTDNQYELDTYTCSILRIIDSELENAFQFHQHFEAISSSK